MAHSKIVGGSTAKRVMNCAGSVALAEQMPEQSSTFADLGTLLHEVMARVLGPGTPPHHLFGLTKGEHTFGPEHMEKVAFAIDAFDALKLDEYVEEARVDFGDLLPGVFGSADIIGRRGNTAVIVDWKFGDGVPVDPYENHQGLFYAAAAARTKGLEWVFALADEVEIVIVQPPSVKVWNTTIDRLKVFEIDLVQAVRKAQQPAAPLAAGDWCRWCPAKAICPLLTGAVDRAIQTKLDNLDAGQIGGYLDQAELLEQFIADLRGLATQLLEAGKPVPGWKLVPKRALRQWVNEDDTRAALAELGLSEQDMTVTKLVSPAQAEKVLGKKRPLPEGLTSAVSSGNTLAPESDPRPAALQIGSRLRDALNRIG